jgi:putative Mn2+ efflux pump MntP
LDWVILFAIAFSLSLDAFAVATIAGITLGTPSQSQRFRLSFHFGIFQALMLAAGWYLGSAVARLLHGLDVWVAFAMLALVGGNIVWNAVRDEKEERSITDPTRGWKLVFLSVSTSLDALAVGISLAMVNSSILRGGGRRRFAGHDAAGDGDWTEDRHDLGTPRETVRRIGFDFDRTEHPATGAVGAFLLKLIALTSQAFRHQARL